MEQVSLVSELLECVSPRVAGWGALATKGFPLSDPPLPHSPDLGPGVLGGLFFYPCFILVFRL